MSNSTVLITRDIQLGYVAVSLHAMADELSADIALSFDAGRSTGLSVGFHASTDQLRTFAAELIRHADLADAAHQQQIKEVA